MPRTLPWLVGKETARVSKTAKQAQTKEPKRQPKEEDSDVDTPIVGRLTKPEGTSKRKRKASRTPSTSPPPIPPAENYMRPGYDKDDGWMMVEDEFYSIAQEFTLPLHRQEYERLKLKGRDEGGANDVRDIARPTSMLAKMREELQRKTEAAALRTKHKRALDGLRSGLLGAGDSDDDDDEEEDAVSDKEDDPWYGTTLHGLMTSPRKVEQALVGLEKVQSNTRAAAGFSQPDLSPLQPMAAGSADQNVRNERRVEGRVNATDSSDDDDLDGLPRVPNPDTRRRLETARPKIQASNGAADSQKAHFEESYTTASSKSKPTKTLKGFNDGFDGGFPDDLPDFAQRGDTTTRSPLQDKAAPQKKKTKKYDDVPTFLV